MTPDAFLAHLRRDAERMAELAPQGLANPVPPAPAGRSRRRSCTPAPSTRTRSPACACPRARSIRSDWDHGPAEGQDPAEWFRERLAELTDELSSRGPQATAYTWYDDDQTVGFWFRRMAQETAVHRTDVESGFDAVTAVADDLAVDGIDEVLDWFLRYQNDDVGEDGTRPRHGGGPDRRPHLATDPDCRRGPALARARPGRRRRQRRAVRAAAVAVGPPAGQRRCSARATTALLAAFRERLRVVTQ